MSDLISRDALEWSLTHIERFGDTDFFPLPFEYAAVRHCWDQIREKLQTTDLANHRPRATRRILVPKPNGSFRIVTQLDPIDTLLYTAAAYEASTLVESSRIPAERMIACSYRIAPQADGLLFVQKSGWPDFHTRSRALAESGEYEYVVVADITDFYNQASQHRIENALELAGVPNGRAKNLERFLNLIAAKQSRGLPVGSSASIVLSEACLNDVDTFLLRRDVAHTRYVDDFRIFCMSHQQAVMILHDLSEYLYTAHRLVLNESKTRIITTESFITGELRDPEEEEEQSRLSLLQQQIEQLYELIGDYGAALDASDPLEDLLDDGDLKRAMLTNIAVLFDGCLQEDRLHLGIARHLLRRAAHLRTNIISQTVFDNIRTLVPVLRDVSNYMISTKRASLSHARSFVEFLLNNPFGQLPFARLWGIHTMLSVNGMADGDTLKRLADGTQEYGRSLAALIAKKYGFVDWVRERKENWSNFGPWDRRALLYAATALPRDERGSWLGVVEESGDLLDAAVAKFVLGST